jgi:hypothetical protein
VLAGETTVEFTNAVNFLEGMTSKLSSIEPRFGTRLGGEKIKFTGTSFDTDHTKYTILIDGVACNPTAASTTFVECTTGKKDGVVKPLGDGSGREFRDFSE